ncbi:MAG: Na+/H+ antiporter NhaC family protein [Planctomycetota bacterium]
MPSALIILTVIVVAAAVATLVLPAGEFERVEKNFPDLVPYTVAEGDTLESIAAKTGAELDGVGDLRLAERSTEHLMEFSPGQRILVPVGGMTRNAVVPGTYRPVPEGERRSLADQALASAGNVTLAPIRGFAERAQIIGFVLLLGGAFGVILATGAIDDGLRWAVLRLGRGKAKWAVIPVSFTLFSLGGAVFGMGESTIAFVLITVPLALRLGYDTMTGVAMCYMASQVGFAGAFFNPFTVGIAQGIAELPYLSGLNFRYVVWFVVTSVGIGFTMWWARRVERNPMRSPTYALDESQRRHLAEVDAGEVGRPLASQMLVMLVAFGSVFVSAYGVAQLNWYIDEMAAMFVVCAVLCGFLARFRARKMSDEFVKGAAMMAEPGLIIAFSAGIVMVLQEGRVLDTILFGLASPLESVSPSLGASALMLVQACLNFFVPSGSGQAAMTMPIVTPLCDLIGLHRQVGVLAFQFGDGFGNLIVPTSAVLMGVLGASRVPWVTWVKWVLPLVIVLHVVGAIFLAIAANGPEAWLN